LHAVSYQRVLKSQAIIYIKWSRWLFEIVLKDKRYVIINMDETSVSNLTSQKKGYVAHATRRDRNRMKEHKPDRDSTDLKTTLLGTICNNAELQPHLPQILLPKYTKAKMPPRRLQEYYTRLGYPIMTWHETCGNNTTPTMKGFLTLLRKVVYCFDPSLWIVMLLDCCTAHLNAEILNHIRSLGMLVIFIPACLTWFLQPLDVYVYAWLKRELRSMYTSARLRSSDSLLRNSDWVPLTGAAIHKVLTHVDWTNAFRRCGWGGDSKAFRPKLQEQVGDDPLQAGRPTEQELRSLLSKAVTKTGKNVDWASLILTFSDTVEQRPANALPPQAANHVLQEVSWTAAPPPKAVCHFNIPADQILSWPMQPVQHFEPLTSLPPGASTAVPWEAVRLSSPVRNTRANVKRLRELDSQEPELTGGASSSSAPVQAPPAPRARRLLGLQELSRMRNRDNCL